MLAPAVFAADNPGTHEHGQAQLQMALENSNIELMFSSPAYNLAGFEHEARTDEQKKMLADIRQWLETTPLVNNGAGACRVAGVTVQLGDEGGSHNHHEEETHRDYAVAQQLTCEGMAVGDTFSTPLPARFPELEALAVEWVGPSGQGSRMITGPGQSFKLSQ
jgi:hypothetical protein